MSISNKLHVVCKVLVHHNKGKEYSFLFCEFFFLNMIKSLCTYNEYFMKEQFGGG